MIRIDSFYEYRSAADARANGWTLYKDGSARWPGRRRVFGWARISQPTPPEPKPRGCGTLSDLSRLPLGASLRVQCRAWQEAHQTFVLDGSATGVPVSVAKGVPRPAGTIDAVIGVRSDVARGIPRQLVILSWREVEE